MRIDGVIPVFTKLIWHNINVLQFLIWYFDTSLIFRKINSTLNLQPCVSRGCRNQADNNFKRYQRPASPVLCDLAEHAVLNLIPF